MSIAPGYAPEFRLLFDGRPAPATLRGSVTSVSATCGFGDADRFELGLANEGLRWLDHELFRLDTPVELWLGYAPEQPERVFAGEVVGADATFPGGGMPTMRVIAQDRRTRLAASSPSRWFGIPIPTVGVMPLPDLAVAAVPPLEHGLLPVIDPLGAAISAAIGAAGAVSAMNDTKVAQSLIRKQAGETSLDFLKKIAAENAWELVIDHSAEPAGLILRLMSPAAHIAPDVTLRYGHSLLDFSPRVSTVGQIAKAVARVWVAAIKLQLTVSVGFDWDRQSLTVEVSPGFGKKFSGDTGVTLVDETLTPANAARVVLGKLLPKLNKRLTAKGTCAGDARIRAGHVLRIEGVGETFGGFWRVTSATHTLDGGGWRTSFDVRKEIWFGSVPAAAQGAAPVHRGLAGLALGG
ncbi:phage late control D family protein [Microbacterium terricola]|uniref:Phage late control D family protein n=1 Tax=Microbacterium terricola TaxID=344163 RepID=A0ABM8E0T1_9MICO|nr:hypothetical protein [Microbacterium terricola]UYK40716.1 hypothetical protein OAU46_03430 [Microbacterium terricola]BDV31547.1 hypothetical protein Microterr_22070 [Microbacterium terricola]